MATVNNLGLFGHKFGLCPATEDTHPAISGGMYPDIWMPVNYTLAMYWRVKKWKFSFEAHWAELDDSIVSFDYSKQMFYSAGQVNIFDDENNILTPDQLEGNNERKLVCGVDMVEWQQVIEGNTSTGNTDSHFYCTVSKFVEKTNNNGTFGTGINATIKWDFEQPCVYTRQPTSGIKEFLPTIEFQMNTLRWKIRAYPWQEYPTPSGTYGEFSYKLLDEVFSVPIYAYNELSDAEDFSNTLSVTASLEAIEYWPYDPDDGEGPIYDSVTGQQLRLAV